MSHLGLLVALGIIAVAIWQIMETRAAVKEIESENARTQRWLDEIEEGQNADAVRPERQRPSPS